MSDPGEIMEVPRTDEGDNSRHEGGIDLTHQNSKKRKRSRKRRNSGGSQGSAQSGRVPEESPEEDESGRQNVQQHPDGRKQDLLPTDQEDYQAQFYEHYHKVAEEYDKEFLKKYEEDLNTTLIFAGLFSAVTSAFIIEVDSQLQSDPGDETAALLRVLIYKIDNTTFGNDIPALPQWAGPPRTLVHVQAILLASLAASLFSTFLAVLGKQWLNRYESTDMRGTAIARSQNRQQKLDGIDAWYFHAVMESLPLMLQVALLLLGCALSLYLWGIDTIIASVVLAITSFGLFFYLFIIVAGATNKSCPYQTPGSQFLRYLGPKIRNALAVVASALENAFMETTRTTRDNARLYRPWWSRANIMPFLRGLGSKIPSAVAADARRLWRAVTRALAALLAGAYRLRRVHHGLRGAIKQQSTSQTAVLDLRCVSWTLQTSLSGLVHLSALKYLMSVLELAQFDPVHVVDCFNIFIGGIRVSNGRVVITQGLEQLATASAECIYRTLHRLTVTDPTSSSLEDLHRRYRDAFPDGIDFTGFPSRHTVTMINALIRKKWGLHPLWRDDDRPSDYEHVRFAQGISELAQAEYRRKQEVPKWILDFAFNSLSLDPRPPASVIADCLEIFVVNLGWSVSDVATLDESAKVEAVSTLIAQQLETMADDRDLPPDSTLAVDCFDVFTICVRTMGTIKWFERLAKACTGFYCHTFFRLAATDPTSRDLETIHRHSLMDSSRRIDSTGLPSRHSITMIHALITGSWSPGPIWRSDDRPSDRDHILFARDTAEFAQAVYQRGREVPKWIPDFALNSLFLDPPPPASIIADCLKVIAIDLGWDVSGIATSDESVQMEAVSNFIIQNLETAVKANEYRIISKAKTICALLPYAIFLEQHGKKEMANGVVNAIRASREYHFMSSVTSYITVLFGKPSSPFRDLVITLVSPHVDWESTVHGENTVVTWAETVLAVLDTDEVIQNVVDTLLKIAPIDSLRPHIPIEIWAWMKKKPSPSVRGWSGHWRTTPATVRYVRGLGDVEITKSYFLYVWSGGYGKCLTSLGEMGVAIREDFGGIGMWCHREDLVNQLDKILKMLKREILIAGVEGGLCLIDPIKGKLQQYEELKEILLKMQRETPTQSTSICSLPLHCL